MGPVAKMCLSFFAVAVSAIVSSGIYMTLKDRLGLDATLGTTPVIILNTLLAGAWYMYASTLQCRNCGAGLTTGALGFGISVGSAVSDFRHLNFKLSHYRRPPAAIRRPHPRRSCCAATR